MADNVGTRMYERRRFASLSGALAAATALLLSFGGIAVAARNGWLSDYFRSDLGAFSTRPFERDVWIASAGYRVDGDANPRGRMLDDLTARLLRPGLTRRHVMRLLGPPEERYGNPVRREYGWVVGRYRDCAQQVLVIGFGPDGRVARVELLMPRDVCDRS